MNYLDKIRGCLFGGAIGDALGYPVEFLKRSEIINKYGEKGLRKLVLVKTTDKALISDDTQMILFTAEGLYREEESLEIDEIYRSYLRWYCTQTSENLDELPSKDQNDYNSIMSYKELYIRRAPGMTCLSALSSGEMGTPDNPLNNSKGCGGVMRVAPVGLIYHDDINKAFEVGKNVAAITHGHPTVYIAAGAFAMIVAELMKGKKLYESVESCISLLKKKDENKETYNALKLVLKLVNSDEEVYECIKKLGEGWAAEEALAIAVFCALKAKTFKEAMIMAVNHDGDSDSTGSICGNLLGVRHGIKVIPKYWLEKIELYELIELMAEKLYRKSLFNVFEEYLKEFKKIERDTDKYKIIKLCERFGSFIRSIDPDYTEYNKYQKEYFIICNPEVNYKNLLQNCSLETYYGLVTYFFREDHHCCGGIGTSYVDKALDGRYEFIVAKIIERLKEKFM